MRLQKTNKNIDRLIYLVNSNSNTLINQSMDQSIDRLIDRLLDLLIH